MNGSPAPDAPKFPRDVEMRKNDVETAQGDEGMDGDKGGSYEGSRRKQKPCR
jgi:hypothetical protein